MSPVVPPLEPLEVHAAEVVGGATGRTLVMWPVELGRALPDSVTSVQHLARDNGLEGVYDSVISVGQLGMATDLESTLVDLRGHLGPTSILHFCEPTIASDLPRSHPPYDVTGSLWANGFSVIQCRRFRARYRLRTHQYCWGRARLTPS